MKNFLGKKLFSKVQEFGDTVEEVVNDILNINDTDFESGDTVWNKQYGFGVIINQVDDTRYAVDYKDDSIISSKESLMSIEDVIKNYGDMMHAKLRSEMM